MRVIEVTWLDAWASQDGHDKDGIEEDHGPCKQYSVGYEAKNDDTGISLAACVDEDEHMDRVLFIPAGMIAKVRVLRG